jgi:dephospho-CoA kinase
VLTVGLTGGIGSGKSAVTRALAARGAAVVDADVVAREVVAPGTPGLAAVVEAFGDQVLRPDGSLDREALGKRVFSDPEQLARLNALVHPRVGERTAELMAEAAATGARVLVHDVPLLVENGLAGLYDVVVVVAATPATQLERLVRLRGMSEQDAQARIDAQAPLADKLAVATHVVHNDGSKEQLHAQVEDLWWALTERADRGT